MSTRSTPHSVTRKLLVTQTHENGNTDEIGGFTGPVINWVDSVTFGTNVPGWRARLRAGESATTTMEGSKLDVRLTAGHLKVLGPKTGDPNHVYLGEATGYMGDGPTLPGDPSSVDETEANAVALGRFNRRIREVSTAFQGGVFLGELGQTLSMIRNPAKGLRGLVDDGYRSLSRVRRLSSQRTLASGVKAVGNTLDGIAKRLGEAYLEVVYGWKPLLSDIRDASNALDRFTAKELPKTVRLTARSKVDGNPSESTVTQGASWVLWNHTTLSVSHCEVIYRGAMRVEAQSDVSMASELLGFDPASFFPTVYELIPYSFLVDYFSNLGEVVEGLSYLGKRLSWCNRTVRRTREVKEHASADTASYRAWYPTVQLSVACVPSKVVATKTSVHRAEFLGTRVPDFRLEVPGSGSLKWLNIAALIASRGSDRKWVYGN